MNLGGVGGQLEPELTLPLSKLGRVERRFLIGLTGSDQLTLGTTSRATRSACCAGYTGIQRRSFGKTANDERTCPFAVLFVGNGGGTAS
jgi:hypothetical protein